MDFFEEFVRIFRRESELFSGGIASRFFKGNRQDLLEKIARFFEGNLEDFSKNIVRMPRRKSRFPEGNCQVFSK